MAAGHLDATATPFTAARGRYVVQHGRGDSAQVHHIQTGRGQTANQRRAERWTRQAPVAPNRHGFFARCDGLGPKRTAQVFSKGFIDGFTHDAADVIGFEYGRVDLHERPCSDGDGEWGRL